MDDADRADLKIENAIADAIREARRDHGMKATGFCLYCSEPVQQHYLFCCGECSQDWHTEQKLKRIAGK
jgi:hypothetical protein